MSDITTTDYVLKKARETGKFTRLESGHYCLYAENTLYYVRKREFLDHRGRWQHEWYWTDGKRPYDNYFGTLAECKKSLYDYFNQESIAHSLTHSQWYMLSVTRIAKGQVVYFYDERYKTPGAKKIARTLVDKGLVKANMCYTSTEVSVWID